jgi:hypothetical protein
MSSVGIKRVFWTTESGIWEGAKVRDLVDALVSLGDNQFSDATIALNNVFVTKDEVLMLRRTMGNRERRVQSESEEGCSFDPKL